MSSHDFNFHDEIVKVEAELVDVVERKVTAAGTAATLVAIVVSLLGLYVFHGDVPDWVIAAVGSIVTGGLTFAAGYIAKHTPRVIPVPPAPTGDSGPAPAAG
ncbi:MAG: hypothetical protein JWQ81_8532 [Amycolatopsis sp.]|jgi:hypothetical protein|uniref:hypothetical protein n=1 Tax=Amycolatopsis sp. TaxID=37632 RepID=UPI0026050E08|nr:hypothetical protein [Amycolatopsis sp.]MCU1687793.1 hypothetical protein [Amycolatopsis sp.]